MVFRTQQSKKYDVVCAMGDNTKIEWCDASWNPISGCSPISDGCQNCYARRMARRLAGRAGYQKDEPFRVTLHLERLGQPLRWKKPRRVFTCSMGDLFHEHVELEHIAVVFGVMGSASQHTFEVLTKRPKRAKHFMSMVGSPTVSLDTTIRGPDGHLLLEEGFLGFFPWPPPNVWLGVSVEKQRYARERLPILCETPAAERFISCEPLLGPLNLTPWLDAISWVIVGAETGPGARPMDPQWALSIRDQCRRHGVRFFFKKDSDGNRELDGQLFEEYPG